MSAEPGFICPACGSRYSYPVICTGQFMEGGAGHPSQPTEVVPVGPEHTAPDPGVPEETPPGIQPPAGEHHPDAGGEPSQVPALMARNAFLERENADLTQQLNARAAQDAAAAESAAPAVESAPLPVRRLSEVGAATPTSPTPPEGGWPPSAA